MLNNYLKTQSGFVSRTLEFLRKFSKMSYVRYAIFGYATRKDKSALRIVFFKRLRKRGGQLRKFGTKVDNTEKSRRYEVKVNVLGIF